MAPADTVTPHSAHPGRSQTHPSPATPATLPQATPAARFYRVTGTNRNTGKVTIVFPGPLTHAEAVQCKWAITPARWRCDALEEL